MLGDAIQDTAFQNTVLDAFIEHMGPKSHCPRVVVYRTFKILPRASPLRKLLVDIFVQFHSSNWLDESIDYYPKEFLLVVSKALMEKLTKVLANPKRKTHEEKPWEVDPCQYHIHPKAHRSARRLSRRIFQAYGRVILT